MKTHPCEAKLSMLNVLNSSFKSQSNMTQGWGHQMISLTLKSNTLFTVMELSHLLSTNIAIPLDKFLYYN